jgi:hypothetical protein
MSSTGELLQAFDAIRDALMAPDPEALEHLIAEDYRGFDLRGHVENREAVIECYQPGVARLEVFEATDVQSHLSDCLGIVTGLGSLTGVYGGDRFSHTVRFCDVFEFRDSRWRLLFTQTTEVAEGE